MPLAIRWDDLIAGLRALRLEVVERITGGSRSTRFIDRRRVRGRRHRGTGATPRSSIAGGARRPGSWTSTPTRSRHGTDADTVVDAGGGDHRPQCAADDRALGQCPVRPLTGSVGRRRARWSCCTRLERRRVRAPTQDRLGNLGRATDVATTLMPGGPSRPERGVRLRWTRSRVVRAATHAAAIVTILAGPPRPARRPGRCSCWSTGAPTTPRALVRIQHNVLLMRKRRSGPNLDAEHERARDRGAPDALSIALHPMRADRPSPAPGTRAAGATPADRVLRTPWPDTRDNARVKDSLLARCRQLGLTAKQTRAVMRTPFDQTARDPRADTPRVRRRRARGSG